MAGRTFSGQLRFRIVRYARHPCLISRSDIFPHSPLQPARQHKAPIACSDPLRILKPARHLFLLMHVRALRMVSLATWVSDYFKIISVIGTMIWIRWNLVIHLLQFAGNPQPARVPVRPCHFHPFFLQWVSSPTPCSPVTRSHRSSNSDRHGTLASSLTSLTLLHHSCCALQQLPLPPALPLLPIPRRLQRRNNDDGLLPIRSRMSWSSRTKRRRHFR